MRSAHQRSLCRGGQPLPVHIMLVCRCLLIGYFCLPSSLPPRNLPLGCVPLHARVPLHADEPKEIKALYKRFRRLDRSGRGTLSNDDLLMIPEIAMNPLSSRLAALFERDGEEGRINFKSFVSALAIFSDRSRCDAKARGACARGGRAWETRAVLRGTRPWRCPEV